jgi:hypothetical protein
MVAWAIATREEHSSCAKTKGSSLRDGVVVPRDRIAVVARRSDYPMQGTLSHSPTTAEALTQTLKTAPGQARPLREVHDALQD